MPTPLIANAIRHVRIEREADHDEVLRRHHIGALILVRVLFFFFFFSFSDAHVQSFLFAARIRCGYVSALSLFRWLLFFLTTCTAWPHCGARPAWLQAPFIWTPKPWLRPRCPKKLSHTIDPTYTWSNTLVPITYYILRPAFNMQNPQSCAIFHGCTYRGNGPVTSGRKL